MAEKKHRSATVIRNSAIIKNPVLFESIGISPVVAMAVSLKSAIILSAVSAVELIVIECITCLLLKNLKGSIRKMIYAFLGLGINIPLFILFKSIAPNETANAGIFLPLLAVNSLIALHCERFAVKHKIKATFLDSLSAGASYAAVIVIVGIIREIFGNGTFYSIKIDIPVRLTGLLMPFGGFMLLGFMAAALKAVINKKYPETHPEASFDLSEVSQSHVIKLREFLNDDLDLYEDGENEDSGIFLEKKHNSRPKVHKEKPTKKSHAPAVRKHNDKKATDKSPEMREPQKAVRDDEDYTSEFSEILSELDKFKENSNEIEKNDISADNTAKGGDEK